MTTEKQYDNNKFFEAYGQMARSIDGLAAAGEWPTFKALLPTLTDKKILDVGCGYGWHCKYMADHGGKSIIGIDTSEKMIQVAQELNPGNQITYQVSALNELDQPKASFDLIISSLVIHYIEDIRTFFKEVAELLDYGGVFLMTVEHPIFTAEGSQDWVYEGDTIAHFPVDNYFIEGARETHFLGETIQKYHHTFTSYFQALTDSGLNVDMIVEPQPPKDMMTIDGMADELRRPMMLIMKATKVANEK